MATFDDFYASLDADKNVRGDQFEKKFVPWFLQTDPEWKSQIDKLWLWDDYPHRWGRDCGIDLVFQDKNGKHWAVQSKCFHPDNWIPKEEINSFFSESNDKRIHGRVLIATTDRIGDNAKQMILRQEKQVVCFLLDNFRKSEIEFPASLKDLHKSKRKKIRTPRPHQNRAIQDVVAGLENARKGQLIMACGTGKTLTSLWIKEELEAQQVLVLVPSLSLLSQTLREWTATAKTHFNWICVCSDESVAKQDRTEDSWFTHVSDIGVPVTGDVKEIKSFLRGAGAKVVFSTYQSSPLIAAAQQDRKIPMFDITFADEAHRCAGNVSEAFGCVLDSKRIRSDKVLFMTATPRILSKQTKSKAEGRDTEIVSMDDPQVFGEVLHQLKFSQAIEQDLLSDYRVVIVGVDHPTIRNRIQNRKLLRTSNGVKLDAETLATHVALAKAVKDYNLHRVISFHSRVAGAKDFAQDHTEVLEWMLPKDRPSGTTITDFVSGAMNTGDRNTKINRLRNLATGEREILSNARCLSEGVDVPSLDGVAFIDPRKSQVDIVQAVGRAIRTSAGKTHGTILIPVFIDEHEDETEALESSRFKPIWDVVNALRSHDDDLALELDSLRTELGKRRSIGASSRGLEKIVFDLPEQCDQSFIDGLRTRLVEQTTASWMFWYGLLQNYVEENGDARPAIIHKTKEGFRLGAWINKQRSKRTYLSLERISLLEKLHRWTWNQIEDQWNDGFEILQEYVKANGKANPPQNYKTKDGFRLGGWITVQRGNKDSLTTERKRILEALPFWTWTPKEDEMLSAWADGISRLQEYVKKNGTAKPPRDHKTKDGFRLGQWVHNKITRKNELSPERISQLEKLPFWTWTPKEDEMLSAWADGISRLQEYVKKNGTARPPADHKTKDGFRLGQWVSNKRTLREKLTPKRRQVLEAFKDWSWSVNSDSWIYGISRLKEYVKKNGTARPPRNHKTKDGFRLGAWISNLRTRRDLISPERRQILESLKDWTWSVNSDSWIYGILRLKEYVKKNGKANPPQHYKTKDGFRLGQWINVQRGNKDSLTTERKQILEALPFWTWTPKEDEMLSAWTDGISRLQEYVKKNGTGRPPADHKTKDGFRLGQWVSKKRTLREKLTPERRQILESLKDWSWKNKFEYQWETTYKELKAFANETGAARPTATFKTKEGISLKAWVRRQRDSKDKLTSIQKRLLESLPGWKWSASK